jgi:hypothetical protein
MKTITRRLLRLEGRFGLVETEESRRARELVETLRRRRAARLAREGRLESDTVEREDLSGLTLVEILQRGWQRARQGHTTVAAQATDNGG